MTKTPQWLPDGSGIDPESLNGDTVVETVNGFCRARHAVGPIVRVFADVTPPKPDPRVEVVARVMASRSGTRAWEVWAADARDVLDALDAMGTAPDERRGL